MNKRQKIVQAQFLNDEEAVITRLKTVYNKSLEDINGKVKQLDSSIAMLQKAYESIDGDEIGDLAASVLGKKVNTMTPEEAQETIKSMLQSKVYQKQYQTALKKQVDTIYDKLQDEEYKTVAEYLDKCYENGFIGTMYDLQGQGIPLCFPLDQEAMVQAVQLDSKISQGLYTRLGEDVALLKKKITAQVSRGISSGMTWQQVAQQLAMASRIGYNNAIRISRTEGHRIQCQSAMDACYKAQDRGAEVVKQWDAALDKRTRESHAKVDGEVRELDERFSNGLRFPGDPNGRAAEVVNCRCALLQRARWALDDAELQTLKDRARYFGLDKTDSFEDFKKKYLKAAENSENSLTKAEKDDIISVPDTLIGKSVGAKAKNYDVIDPATGEYFRFVEGSRIHNSEVFAGYGVKKALNEDVAEGLAKEFGGDPAKWQHAKGFGTLDYHGEELDAEVHWFQEETVGKVKFKVKKWLE